MNHPPMISLFFFFNDTATTEIYTLSLHDALPICILENTRTARSRWRTRRPLNSSEMPSQSPADTSRVVIIDRKSTRLNSSHDQISYAVFCLKKKKKIKLAPQSHAIQRHNINICSR